MNDHMESNNKEEIEEEDEFKDAKDYETNKFAINNEIYDNDTPTYSFKNDPLPVLSLNEHS